MINQQFQRVLPTRIDLNGPILTFTQVPSGVTGTAGGTVQLTGVATATFPNNSSTPTGSIAYRWYEEGVGALSDGNRLSGTNTNTLTISNLQSPGDNNRKFYLEARYTPSAYNAGRTGRAINEPIYSNVVGSGVQLPPAPSASIFLSSGSIEYNGSVTVYWSSSGATSLSSNFGRSELNGSITINNLTSSRTFVITASNQGGSTTRSVTVNVGAAPQPPTVNISVSPSSIAYDGSATLTWNSSNATSVTSSNFGATSVSGTRTVSNLTSSQTYSISVSGPAGSASANAFLSVAAPPPPPSAPSASLTASSTSISYNGSVTLTWSTSGATSLTSNFGQSALNGSVTLNNLTSTTTYEINATGPGGTTTKRVTINVGARPAPTASISASPSSIANGGSTTITWSTSDADSLTSNFGETALNGSRTFTNLTASQTYQISATNTGGTTTRDVTVSVAPPLPVIRITSQPTDSSVNEGTFATFRVVATVDNPTGATLQYQWYVNGSPVSNTPGQIGGSNTDTLNISRSAGNYTVFCRVSYTGANSLDSRTANYIVNRVVVIPTISITQQPSNQTVSINQTATFTVQGSASDGSAVSYQWFNAATNGALSNASTPSGTISGVDTRTLSISYNTASTTSYYARVSHPTASNSPQQSNTVSLVVTDPRNIIKFGTRGDDSTSISYADVDLTSFSLAAGAASYEVYAPEKDIVVRVRLLGGQGANNGSFTGGVGGRSVVQFTLKRNTEYIFRALSAANSGSGGAAAYIYEKGTLLAVVGGGGSAGRNGNGGRGGGCNIGGESGSGSGAGQATSSSIQTVGFFNDGNVYCDSGNSSSRNGGQISRCPPGDPSCQNPVYWRLNYPSSCDGYGVSQARNATGQIVSGSATIDRGFKGGVGHRNNAGHAQVSGDGAGGAGARGGQAAQNGSGAGGSGGSGWAGVTVVSSSLGGGTSGGTNGQFLIALASSGIT